ncbi:MAG: hypothetical protein GF317_22305 [Candidatus Lokiarchaeota archaeon]|nr:hypothetical protein [Candidatus Lokiarchaeota archaeon]MBD3202194.1 hypothetical protein [Candidatus Lokiarchaeota archaeon]
MNTKTNASQLDFCPFTDTCQLPQVGTICTFPNCKVCPEYQEKVRKVRLN